MTIEQGIRERRMGDAVRLQYDPDLPKELLARLVEELELTQDDLYPGKGFTAFTDLFQLYAAANIPRLKDRPQTPISVPCFERGPDIWNTIRSGDVMVFHPYQSFEAVTRFVEEAAKDPRVLAIKMTLYRVSPNSPIAQALARAAEAGKEYRFWWNCRHASTRRPTLHGHGRWKKWALTSFTAWLVIRLTAKYASWFARMSTASGVTAISRPATITSARAQSIAILDLFTCRESFGEDLTELFNLLTGYTRPQKFHHLALAPTGLREHFLVLIQTEAKQARLGRPARIIAKVNSLIDAAIIEQLYLAGQAGVEIDLLVRGMCSLRPGIQDVSENIRVISIVDRYLEHARIFYFHNGGKPTFWLASADWMPRNFTRRIEIAFPVLEPQLQRKLMDILERQLADSVKAWRMEANGRYVRKQTNNVPPFRFQERFYETLREAEERGIVEMHWHD